MARISDPEENELAPIDQPANGKTIILAEDDPFIMRMYQTKLTSVGYKVVPATNGRDALEKIKAEQPDLAILDINMPDLTGFEVIRALHEDGSVTLAMEKILVLTNSADPDDRHTASVLGVDYLVKAEMTPREVLNRINQKLGLPQV